MRAGKPKPTVLHKLHGTLNVTRHRDRAFEPPAMGTLEDSEAPAELSAGEADAWRYAIEHAPRGVLRQIDRDLLLLWCQARERYRRAREAQEAMNLATPELPDLIRGAKGQLLPSPYLHQMHKTALLLMKLASEMGFTPAARPRLAIGASAPAEAKEGDRWVKVMSLARKPSNRP